MVNSNSGGKQNLGVCGKCNKIVPLDHRIRDQRVYLLKKCPDCGETETLISSSAEDWQNKREQSSYGAGAEKTCSLKCTECNHGKIPSLVFVDVTNRCNMNCPIC